MYKGYKVKALVFAGRKDTMSILFPKIKSDILDEVLIGINTKNKDDIAFIDSYIPNDKKFKKVAIPEKYIRTADAYYYMFSLLTDEDTIYIKLDDDLIWFSENFFEELVKYRVEHPEYYTIYPFVVNNPLCNYLGKYFTEFNNQSDYMFKTWKEPKYAYFLLRAFAEKNIDINDKIEYAFDDSAAFKRTEIGFPICPSINCICFFGKDCKEQKWAEQMKKFGSDEGYITRGIFYDYGKERKNVVYSGCQCVHYAFFTQRDFLNKKQILKFYK